ncbi:hypothetical protein, partial [Spiroplasma endosymbiont of Danaus chrysippus]
ACWIISIIKYDWWCWPTIIKCFYLYFWLSIYYWRWWNTYKLTSVNFNCIYGISVYQTICGTYYSWNTL